MMKKPSGEDIKKGIRTALKQLRKKIKDKTIDFAKKKGIDIAANIVGSIPPLVGAILKEWVLEFKEDPSEKLRDMVKLAPSEWEKSEEILKTNLLKFFKGHEDWLEGKFKEIKDLLVETRDYARLSVELLKEEKSDKKRIAIPTIEDVLHKGDERYDEPAFFREYMGSLWIDFENGYMTRREKEMTKIYEGLKEGIVLIKGGPASGKSVILRYIGYELIMKGNEVYVIELKRKKPKIESVALLQNCYLIIDDMHLDVSYVERILDYKNALMGKGVKFLISSREIERELIGEVYRESKALYDSGINIEANNAYDEIITNFSLLSGLSENEVEMLEEKLEGYKADLFQLGFTLKNYSEKRDTTEDEILKWVKRSIVNRLKKEYDILNADNIFLILSTFYQYEIEVHREFLESLGIIESRIDELIIINEIIEDDYGFLTLHHTSRAEMFLKAINKFDLGREIKKKIGANFEVKLFNKYIQSCPKYSFNLIYSLGSKGLWEGNNNAYRLMKEVIKKENENYFKTGIRKTEKDVGSIGFVLHFITLGDRGVAREIVRDAREEIKKRVKDPKESIGGIGRCISFTTELDPDVGKDIVRDAEEDLKNKMKKTIKYVTDIILGVNGINEADREIGKRIVRYAREELRETVKESKESVKDIGHSISAIYNVEPKIGKKIANDAWEELKKRVEDSKESIYNIGRGLYFIINVDYIIGKMIMIDTKEDLEKKVKESKESFNKVCYGISWIAQADSKIGKEIARDTKDELKKRLTESKESIEDISKGINWITEIDTEIGKELQAILDNKK